jgi:hypothetical protein
VAVPSGERTTATVSSGVRAAAIPVASGCGGRLAATLRWRTGKHRRCFRTGRAAAAVISGVRAAVILGASGFGAPRRATDGDAPMAGGQASTVLPNRTSGGGAP